MSYQRRKEIAPDFDNKNEDTNNNMQTTPNSPVNNPEEPLESWNGDTEEEYKDPPGFGTQNIIIPNLLCVFARIFNIKVFGNLWQFIICCFIWRPF